MATSSARPTSVAGIPTYSKPEKVKKVHSTAPTQQGEWRNVAGAGMGGGGGSGGQMSGWGPGGGGGGGWNTFRGF